MYVVIHFSCQLSYDIAAELKMDVVRDKDALALFTADLKQDTDWVLTDQKQAGYAKAKLTRYHIEFGDTFVRTKDLESYKEEITSATARAGETEPAAFLGDQPKIKIESEEYQACKFNKQVVQSSDAKLARAINERKRLKFDLEAVKKGEAAHEARLTHSFAETWILSIVMFLKTCQSVFQLRPGQDATDGCLYLTAHRSAGQGVGPCQQVPWPLQDRLG